MSDDSFFREVSEELRQDRVKAIWTRFGSYILAAVLLVIVVTAGVVGWDRYTQSQANASGDRYLAALKLSEDGKADEAVAALQAIVADGYGAYPDLARMSIGSVRAQQGQPKKAVAAFDAVANDAAVPQPIRDMAAIRAAYILVDSGTLAEVQDRVQRLIGDSEPMRFPAREAVGLAAWKAGDAATARKMFQQLADDGSTPQGIAGRARLMLDIIKSGDAAPNGKAAQNAGQADGSAAGAVKSATALEPQGDAAASADGAGAGTVVMPTTDLGATEGASPAGSAAATAQGDPAPAEAPSTPSAGAASEMPAPSSSPASTPIPAPPGPGSAAPGPTPQPAPAGSAN